MNEETTYTDEEVQNIAEKMAERLRNSGSLMRNCLFTSKEYSKGPFGIMSVWSKDFNPLGGFPVETEALTVKQKSIITKIVGKAMTQVGVDHPDYEKDTRESKERIISNVKSQLNRGDIKRDWDLEQRLKNTRNHRF